MRIVVISVIFVTLAVLLLGVKVFFVKGGRFPSGHVHDVPALRDKNVTCALRDEKKKRLLNNKKHPYNI